MSNRKIEKILDQIAGDDLTPEKIEQIKNMNSDKKELTDLIDMISSIKSVTGNASYKVISESIMNLSSKIYDDFLKSKRRKQRKRGILIFDSTMLPLPVGVRPATVDTIRRKYRFDDFLLEIAAYPINAENFEIMGQLKNFKGDSTIEILIKSGNNKYSAQPDEFGIFRFEKIVTGNYILQIMSPDKLFGTIDFDL